MSYLALASQLEDLGIEHKVVTARVVAPSRTKKTKPQQSDILPKRFTNEREARLLFGGLLRDIVDAICAEQGTRYVNFRKKVTAEHIKDAWPTFRNYFKYAMRNPKLYHEFVMLSDNSVLWEHEKFVSLFVKKDPQYPTICKKLPKVDVTIIGHFDEDEDDPEDFNDEDFELDIHVE